MKIGPLHYPLTLLLSAFCMSTLHADVEEIVETFRGDGPYNAGHIKGLDNPDWSFHGDAELTAEGYRFEATSIDAGGRDSGLRRPLEGTGSFIQTLVIREPMIPESNDISISAIGVANSLAVDKVVQWNLRNPEEHDEWNLSVFTGDYGDSVPVPRGSHVSVELWFDANVPSVSLLYDSDIDDESVPPTQLGPIEYTGTFAGPYKLHVLAGAGGSRPTTGIFPYYSIQPYSPQVGDFFKNEQLDVDDVDMLQAQIASQSQNVAFDLTGDAVVEIADLSFWIHDLKNTYFGDANLDGQFNSGDLTIVFQAGQYEDTIEGNSTWATGDWNADAEFTSSDLVVAFQDGWYEQGPRAAVQSVPEPTGFVLFILAMCAFVGCRRLDEGAE